MVELEVDWSKPLLAKASTSTCLSRFRASAAGCYVRICPAAWSGVLGQAWRTYSCAHKANSLPKCPCWPLALWCARNSGAWVAQGPWSRLCKREKDVLLVAEPSHWDHLFVAFLALCNSQLAWAKSKIWFHSVNLLRPTKLTLPLVWVTKATTTTAQHRLYNRHNLFSTVCGAAGQVRQCQKMLVRWKKTFSIRTAATRSGCPWRSGVFCSKWPRETNQFP